MEAGTSQLWGSIDPPGPYLSSDDVPKSTVNCDVTTCRPLSTPSLWLSHLAALLLNQVMGESFRCPILPPNITDSRQWEPLCTAEGHLSSRSQGTSLRSSPLADIDGYCAFDLNTRKRNVGKPALKTHPLRGKSITPTRPEQRRHLPMGHWRNTTRATPVIPRIQRQLDSMTSMAS